MTFNDRSRAALPYAEAVLRVKAREKKGNPLLKIIIGMLIKWLPVILPLLLESDDFASRKASRGPLGTYPLADYSPEMLDAIREVDG